MEQVNPRWRKPSYSGNGANCVEAGSIPGAVLVRLLLGALRLTAGPSSFVS